MLFNKKDKLTIGETVVKKDLCAPDGAALVKLNLRAPSIRTRSKKDPLLRHARPFYDSLVSTLEAHAGRELLNSARAAHASGENFRPFAAVMTWELTYISEYCVSFITDISLSDGRSADKERRTQIWERLHGRRLGFDDFFDPKAVKTVAKALYPGGVERRFDRELFVIRDGGFDFFARDAENRFISAHLDPEQLKDFLRKTDF